MTLERIVFVSAPGTSIFMEEILAAVADVARAAASTGVEVSGHRGLVSEVVDAGTVAVVVPHEYYALAPPEPAALGARTVAFGVEHPGTEEFETSVRGAAGLADRFEISADSVQELARRGIAAAHFPLGLVPAWDCRADVRDRDVDVAYLGTADARRIGILARAAYDLAGLHTELVIPPHEQITGPRPDFLVGRGKWTLLARSKVLINLHRGSKTALEWVRVLEAVANGCAVVTEPSDDLGPLRPGEHLLVAGPDEIGRAAAELAGDEPRRAAMAEAALELCRSELDMTGAAARLVDACRQAAAAAPPPADLAPPPVPEPGRHLAVWLPAADGGSWAPRGLEPAPMATQVVTQEVAPAADGAVAVLCTSLAGDGRVATTTGSVAAELPDLAVHVRRGGDAGHRGEVRNRLLERSDEPFLAVLDAGDALIGTALARMTDLLRGDPGLDAVLCPATYGDTLVNVLLPDEQRLRQRVYLTRGYVVRRSTLDALGGFTEAPDLADLVDHHFWLSLTAGGGRTAMLRRIGLALGPTA